MSIIRPSLRQTIRATLGDSVGGDVLPWEERRRKSGADFSPSQLSDLRAWYAPGNWTTDGSGNISQWDDSSGNGHHATQASAGARPTPSTLAGVEAAEFTALTDFLSAANHADLQMTSGLYFFAMVESSDGNGNRGILGKWGGSPNEYALLLNMFGGAGAGASQLFVRNSADTASQSVTDGDASIGAPALVQAGWDGSDIRLRVNDAVESTTAAATAATNTTDLSIGAYSGAATAPQQKIAEIVIAVPTADEISDLRTYFADNYGVAV